ncbi:wax ester/triacylglycerol synthase family O-acyltransferase [Nocardia terpenica]|uniref:WS/DGAT/MGAT family O-acyltransferase n=1 Tax=Nocardia terpenica TaxID=455432 RepID=UPI0018936D8B|nr:wax ester/triacylglycerol synthase family O-acyltransferase [Nocardia terpenica]MBF6063179.1 wax ester/triacylglycerol synthase family O-acyltransferase [Nocardia terpenica]MBF6105735.1 wax ester/triacylglycerol synthase family O-acyltransferase [Nocardia terpenica]MBF6113681.1 wax ester/triacylglycerol synthase family O-acyltransferase [Nocardia terpenica]MBF6119476.1 wax ester/triacylglycerol synthase family O-acyltransferase [Nocardia terpenica]MBF6151887.1 wax ester/triacylglycerol synt
MITRLTPQDASFHRLESSSNPMHIGSLAIVRGTSPGQPPLDYDRLVDLVSGRLPLVPRYRRKVREIPFALGRPVWVEDSRFDVGYHVRRSALPTPGTDEQLHDLVARLASRPLDHTRPLWEMYLIEGLSENRLAIFTKTHTALVDGSTALEIGHVILDAGPSPREVADDAWSARREPGEIELLAMALFELAAQPGEALEVVRHASANANALVSTAAKAVDRVVSMVRTAALGTPDSPFNTPTSRNRRFDVVRTELEDYRRIRRRFDCSINDVILAVVTGALRIFLQSRGEVLTESAVLRAVVPMSVYVEGPHGDRLKPASEVSSFLVDLPVGEPNPVMRLSHIAHATEAHARHRRGVRARTLVHMAGFAPASLHAMSVRAASTFAEHTFNLVITNAPGPQQPMYIGGARMLEMYPVSPLLRNQATSIGITSYDGHVFYGLNADRDAMADIGVLSAAVRESMEEMLGACVE